MWLVTQHRTRPDGACAEKVLVWTCTRVPGEPWPEPHTGSAARRERGQRPLLGLLRPSCLWQPPAPWGSTYLLSTVFQVEGGKWPTAISRGRGGSASGLCCTELPVPGLCLTGSSGFYQSWLPYCVCSSFTQLHPKLVGFDVKSRLFLTLPEGPSGRALWPTAS